MPEWGAAGPAVYPRQPRLPRAAVAAARLVGSEGQAPRRWQFPCEGRPDEEESVGARSARGMGFGCQVSAGHGFWIALGFLAPRKEKYKKGLTLLLARFLMVRPRASLDMTARAFEFFSTAA